MNIEQLDLFCELMLSARFERFYNQFILGGNFHERSETFLIGINGLVQPIGGVDKVYMEVMDSAYLFGFAELFLSDRFEEFYNDYVSGGNYSEKDIPFKMQVDKIFAPIFD